MISLVLTFNFFNYGYNVFLYLKWNILTTILFDKQKTPSYCYEVLKNQRKVKKVWIFNLNFSI